VLDSELFYFIFLIIPLLMETNHGAANTEEGEKRKYRLEILLEQA